MFYTTVGIYSLMKMSQFTFGSLVMELQKYIRVACYEQRTQIIILRIIVNMLSESKRETHM